MSRDNNGWTALHYAAASGQSKVCQILLAAGVPVDTRDNHNNTSLHMTCHFDSIKRGLEEEESPLHLLETEQSAIVSLLLEAGADTRAQDDEGRTPVDLATSRGWSQVVDMMTRQDKEAAVSRSSE